MHKAGVLDLHSAAAESFQPVCIFDFVFIWLLVCHDTATSKQ